jgi:hypothetical protein
MPLYITDGTTAKKLEGHGVVWSSGYSTTDVSHFDVEYSSARSAGYGRFIIELHNVQVDGYQLIMTPMSAANTPDTIGCYGGYYSHGEGVGVITDNDANFNNRRGFPISALKGGAELNSYMGNYTINIGDPTQGTSNAFPNVWWHGTHRIANSLASHIAGAGVHNRNNSHYGVRFETNDTSNNRILEYGYTLYALRSGTASV